MQFLKQSTAVTIKLGPFIDDTDGKTAKTGLTISQADIRLSKNGGDIAQTNDATGATHDELGYYNVPLDATDTNTLGRLLVAVHESGALPVWKEFLVVTANVWDTLCATDNLDVNVTALADDVITAAKFDESTAFPLKSADTGATAVARTGADSDTLETLSDEIAVIDANVDSILEDTATTIPATLTTIDNLVDDLETRLTAARAGYLDNLNSGVALTAAGIDAILDEVVVGAYTMRQLLKLFGAKMHGKATGGGTTSIKYTGLDDVADVIIETVDASGNRSAVTLTV